MPRPKSKPELITAANEWFGKLWALIDSMSDEEQTATFNYGSDFNKTEAHWKRDKNLRDIIVHLYEWHQMVQRWHEEGTVNGGMPAVPGAGYTWKTLPELNQKIWEQYQDISLENSKAMLLESHAMVMDLVDAHTNEELFTRGVYKWTKSSTLGAYFISCTSSHYDWAIKKLKVHIKSYRK